MKRSYMILFLIIAAGSCFAVDEIRMEEIKKDKGKKKIKRTDSLEEIVIEGGELYQGDQEGRTKSIEKFMEELQFYKNKKKYGLDLKVIESELKDVGIPEYNAFVEKIGEKGERGNKKLYPKQILALYFIAQSQQKKAKSQQIIVCKKQDEAQKKFKKDIKELKKDVTFFMYGFYFFITLSTVSAFVNLMCLVNS